MFTGIIEATGRVLALTGARLVIAAPFAHAVAVGESVAVNGCCLTAIAMGPDLAFDLSAETLTRTALGSLSTGDAVNLERAMRADGRFGGHIVQGHVDATGEVISAAPVEGATVVRFRVPAGFQRYLIDKGSIAVDGVALTVVSPTGPEFDAWIIPHTLTETNLGDRRPGDRVNLEFDVLAKYVERLMGGHED